MQSVLTQQQCLGHSTKAFQSQRNPAKCFRSCRQHVRRPIAVRAEKSGIKRLLEPFEGFSKEEEVSFRWDPANLRWAKSKGKLADDASMMITPLIGEPYMVSCIVRWFTMLAPLLTQITVAVGKATSAKHPHCGHARCRCGLLCIITYRRRS